MCACVYVLSLFMWGVFVCIVIWMYASFVVFVCWMWKRVPWGNLCPCRQAYVHVSTIGLLCAHVCVCVCVSAEAQNVYCCVFVFAYGLSVYTNHAHWHRLAGAYLAENVYFLCTFYFYFVHMSLLACNNLWVLKNWKAHVSVVMVQVWLCECACTLTHVCLFALAASCFYTAALFSIFSVI